MEPRVGHAVAHPRCYIPLDYGYDGGRYGLASARQPLQESTGNVQHAVQQHHQHQHQHQHQNGGGGLSASRGSCTQQQLDAFDLVRSSMHTPPVLMTQALPGPSYPATSSSSSSSSSLSSSTASTSSASSAASSYYYRRFQQPHQFAQYHPSRRSGINPLCLSRQFQQYRTKQAQKEDKSDQTWPDVLEDAFLDALLLIPHMGRKKYGMNQKQCGRNMLITDYLWIAYCESLPPGVLPDPKMKRHRKQVSSHIQVLKGFFRHHPMYHIFFSKEEKRDDKAKDTVEAGSLKDHPVLRALAENRLPDERPNYDYFARLLAFESQITVKPKRCWIFVAHADVAARADGSGFNPATGEELAAADYPHLGENLARDTWPREDRAMLSGALLHRFTRALEQVESSSVREISAQWAADFPELAARLDAATVGAASGSADGAANGGGCDILHMHLTLEMQRRRHFPAQSELNSWVEINVEQPHLLNHRWKVVTRLARPAELSRSGSSSSGSSGDINGNSGSSNGSTNSSSSNLYETSAEMGVQYVHQPRCEAPVTGQPCDCIGQSHRQVVSVPFPADVWARTLTNCAEYPAHPLVLDRQAEKGNGSRGSGAKGKSDEHEERSVKSKIKRHLTQMELVPKVAMFQEVWSCPPGSTTTTASTKWKRRAVMLWTFETVHSISYTMRGKNELITQPEGKGQWRFLTTLDPTSQYHQKRSLLSANAAASPPDAVSPGPTDPASLAMIPSTTTAAGASHPHRLLSRDDIMSPTPSYHQQLGAGMSENFSLAWDAAPTAVSVPGAYPATLFSHAPGPLHNDHHQQQQHHHHHNHHSQHHHHQQHAAALYPDVPASSGLATPPPTASLAGTFATHSDAGGPDLSFMAAAVTTSAGMNGSISSLSADQFLGPAGAAGGYDVYGGGGGGGSGSSVGGDGGDGSLSAADCWDVDGLSGMGGDARLVPGPWPAGDYSAAAGVLDWSTAAAASPASVVSAHHHHPHPHPHQQQQHHHQQQQQQQPLEGAATSTGMAAVVKPEDGGWGGSGIPDTLDAATAADDNPYNHHHDAGARRASQLHPPMRTKSLKRGWDESGIGRDDDGRAPTLKMARYAATSAADLD